MLEKIVYIFMSFYLSAFIINYTFKRKEENIEPINYDDYNGEQQKIIKRFIKKMKLVFNIFLILIALATIISYGIVFYAIYVLKTNFLLCLPLLVATTSGLICGIILGDFKFKRKGKI